MRILYHHRILARDGMNVHVTEIVAALRRRGHSVVVAGPAYETGEVARGAADGRRSVAARLGGLRERMPAWAGEMLELGYNLVAYPRIRRLARSVRPDTVYERYNLFLLAGVWLKRVLGVPLLLEVNAPLVHERATHGTLSLRRVAAWAEGYVWRRADMVLPVSEVLADRVRAAGVPEVRIQVIPNGVRDVGIQAGDTASAPGAGDGADRATLGLDGKVVFGFVGFVRPWHGMHRVLEAFARSGRSDLHLLIVGDGPARAEMEHRAADLGVQDHLTFTGVVAHDAIPAYLALFDVALQPDVTAYASPLKLVEYMAAGCAIVAPDRRNIREIVTDGATALLFEPDSAEAFDAAIRRLADDRALRRRLGAAAARAVIDEGRTWDANAARIEAIMTRLCGAPTSAEASTAITANRAAGSS